VIDPRPYKADFDRAAAEVDRMDAQLKLAEIELNRAKELRGKATISAASSIRRLLPIKVRRRQKFGRSRQNAAAKSGVHANQISDRRPSE
jgi:hypothetical protein